MKSAKMQRIGRLLLVLFALACIMVTWPRRGEEAVSNFYGGHLLSLLPPVVAIVLALITKEVYSSLFIGILVGFVLQANFDPVMTFNHLVNGFVGNIGGNAGILIFLVILGCLVALMIRAGGSKAYGDWAVAHIKTKAGALWSTFILAIVLGVDDYFNNLTTGNVMRPVTDSHHISRAKLSYMCDATAAPVCIMMPISSWAAAVTGVINNEELGFQIFLRAIPYNYYAVLTMVFIIMMTALNIDYGPMKKHEDNAAKGDLYTTPERPYANVEEMKFNPNGKGHRPDPARHHPHHLLRGRPDLCRLAGRRHRYPEHVRQHRRLLRPALRRHHRHHHRHDLLYGPPFHEVHRADGLPA